MQELNLVLTNPSEKEFIKSIEWNKEFIETAIENIVNDYKGLVYTTENIKVAKEDKAKLNKLKKELDDKRKEVKKLINNPYEVFEKEIKTILSKVDVVISDIDLSISAYEKEQKENKKKEIEVYFEEVLEKAGDDSLKEFLSLDRIFEEKWLNASVTITKVKVEVTDKVNKIIENLNNIDSYSEQDKAILRKFFIKDLNLENAMKELLKHKELERISEEAKQKKELEEASKKAELERQKEEAKAKEVEEKIIAGLNKDAENLNAEDKNVVEEKTEIDFIADDEEIFTVSLKIFGTKTQLNDLKKYLGEKGINSEKI